MEHPKGSLDLCSTYTKWLNLDIFSLFVRSGTCWSQTWQPLWPLRSCVRRWEQCAALPSSSPSHSSGSMMKVGVPRRKILHISLCALSRLLWPFYTSAKLWLISQASGQQSQSKVYFYASTPATAGDGDIMFSVCLSGRVILVKVISQGISLNRVQTSTWTNGWTD